MHTNLARRRLASSLEPLFALVVVAVLGSIATGAEPVRISFVARVHNVYDPGDALHEAIAVGDLLHGTVTYDPSAPDTNPAPNVGRYEFRRPPYGMVVEAGQLVFQTDPKHVDFSVVLAKGEGTPPRDSYTVTSSNNLALLIGATVTRMSWKLVDDTLTALTSTKLPAGAPDLDKWRSELGLTLEGQGTVEFIIRAHVTEAKLCTRDMRCPSPE